jgi:cytoskeletal protein CcmA (bactofilin family)
MAGAEPLSSESVVHPGLVIEGKLDGEGSLRLAGQVKGQLSFTGDVTIEREGAVEGEVRANRVVVAGEAKAHIVAVSDVQIQASATLIGDVEAENVGVAPGARIRGSMSAGTMKTDGRIPDARRGAPARKAS